MCVCVFLTLLRVKSQNPIKSNAAYACWFSMAQCFLLLLLSLSKHKDFLYLLWVWFWLPYFNEWRYTFFKHSNYCMAFTLPVLFSSSLFSLIFSLCRLPIHQSHRSIHSWRKIYTSHRIDFIGTLFKTANAPISFLVFFCCCCCCSSGCFVCLFRKKLIIE